LDPISVASLCWGCRWRIDAPRADLLEAIMSRSYNAFLIRHWSLDTERSDRIEVVHVGSGDRSLVTSMTQAASWMQRWVANEGTAADPSAADVSSCADRCDLPSLLLL
jgi:hypothetical protein